MITSPAFEWRENKRVQKTLGHECKDLYIHDEYQHIWIVHNISTGGYACIEYMGSVSPIVFTFVEAEMYALATVAARKLQGVT